MSVSTLKFDQTLKAEVYARAGINDYWLLNIPAHQLQVRRDPGPLEDGTIGYRSVQVFSYDGQVSPLVAPDAVINVADMLPLMLTNDTPNDTNDDVDTNASDDAITE